MWYKNWRRIVIYFWRSLYFFYFWMYWIIVRKFFFFFGGLLGNVLFWGCEFIWVLLGFLLWRFFLLFFDSFVKLSNLLFSNFFSFLYKRLSILKVFFFLILFLGLIRFLFEDFLFNFFFIDVGSWYMFII